MKITPQTANVHRLYNAALDAADSLAALRTAVEYFSPITKDALTELAKWTEEDFAEWRRLLPVMRMPDGDAGEEAVNKYGAVQMPIVMFVVEVVALTNRASWGETFLQLEAAGLLRREEDGAVFTSQEFVDEVLDHIVESEDPPYAIN